MKYKYAIVILLVSAVFRQYRISEIPAPYLAVAEEYQTGNIAYNWMTGGSAPIEFPLTNAAPILAFKTLGISLSTARIPFIITGILTPVVFYFALAEVLSLQAAFGAATLLAENQFAALGSRVADELFFPQIIVALIMLMLVWAIKKESVWASGILAALSFSLFFEYTGYRIIPLFVLSTIIYYRQWLALGIASFVCIFLSVLVVDYFPAHVINAVFFEAITRHTQSNLHIGQEILLRLKMLGSTVLITPFPVTGLQAEVAPVFDPFTGALILGGIIVAAYKKIYSLLLLVFSSILVVSVLPVNFYEGRLFSLLLPLFCLVGVGLDIGLPKVVVPILLVFAFITNIAMIDKITESQEVFRETHTPINVAISFLHELPQGTEVVIEVPEIKNALGVSDWKWLTYHLKPSSGNPNLGTCWIVSGIDRINELRETFKTSIYKAKFEQNSQIGVFCI